jgi:DedD protein
MTVPFVEQRPQPTPTPPQHDPELTLSSGTLVAIGCGLVLLCGLCFGLGYTVGHHRPQESMAAAQPVDSTQPPSEISASAPKPSANKQPAASAPPDAGGGQPGDPVTAATADAQEAMNSRGSQPVVGAGASSEPSGTASTQVQPTQARNVAPAVSTNPQPGPGFTPDARVQPALSPQAAFLVQIASVSHPEDASVLVNALRQRGYTVTAQRKPEDGLIHVWIGPFSSRDEANRWKLKLLDDGYNAIVQP